MEDMATTLQRALRLNEPCFTLNFGGFMRQAVNLTLFAGKDGPESVLKQSARLDRVLARKVGNYFVFDHSNLPSC